MNRIKQLRLERRMTQEELAKHLGIKQQTISSYESGVNRPDIDTLGKLAEFFGVSVDYIGGFSDIRDPADKIAKAISDDEDLKLFWENAQKRQELKLLFKQIKDLRPEEIKRIIRIIKAIEDEDANNN